MRLGREVSGRDVGRNGSGIPDEPGRILAGGSPGRGRDGRSVSDREAGSAGPAGESGGPVSYRLDAVGKEAGGATHLFPMTFDLVPGGLNVLLGPTLAGKTSVLRLLAGLDRPTTGRILAGDRDVTNVPARRRNVAMVYQDFINYPSFTVYENIASPLRRAGMDRAGIDRKVREAAAALRIDRLLDRLPSQLSGGQQQRTAIARALVKEADLLLLDEPLVNLDYKLREELRVELRQIFERRRATVVYATTEPLEALLLGGHVVVLDRGRLLQVGPTIEVFRNPASVDVGRVFSDPPINLLTGVVADGEAVIGPDLRFPLRGHMAQLGPGSYRFGVRSSHLTLMKSSGGEAAFGAVVDLAEISGSETFIHVTYAGAQIVAQQEGVHTLRLGQPVTLYVDPSRLFVFEAEGAGRLLAAPDGRRSVVLER